tara:strand:+ start:1686 stop:2090 length:405 start_codon:yes stop_codon:yes gene_type:complete
MSWGKNYTASNNLYLHHPPIMHDGRNYATYRPDELLNQEILVDNRIMSNSEYREYLKNNATKIIETNQLESVRQINCKQNFKKPYDNYNKPYIFGSPFDTNQPYGYENSDLKRLYLTREQLQSRMIAPVVNINK